MPCYNARIIVTIFFWLIFYNIFLLVNVKVPKSPLFLKYTDKYSNNASGTVESHLPESLIQRCDILLII